MLKKREIEAVARIKTYSLTVKNDKTKRKTKQLHTANWYQNRRQTILNSLVLIVLIPSVRSQTRIMLHIDAQQKAGLLTRFQLVFPSRQPLRERLCDSGTLK